VLEFINPPGVHSPLGLYSHTVVVPGGTELVYLSGQLGVRPWLEAGRRDPEQSA